MQLWIWRSCFTWTPPVHCTNMAKHAVILPKIGNIKTFLATPAEAVLMFLWIIPWRFQTCDFRIGFSFFKVISILKLECCLLAKKVWNKSTMICSYFKITYIVDKETNVLKAPGVMVLMWLSYRERSLTELSPAKVSLFMQLIELLLSILKRLKQEIRKYWEWVQFQVRMFCF